MTSILQELHEAHKARALRLGIIQPQKPVVLPEVMVSAKSADLRRKADRDRVRRMQRRAREAELKREKRAERVEMKRSEIEGLARLRTTDGRPTMIAIVAEECLKVTGVTPHDVRGRSQLPIFCKVRSASCYRIALTHPEYTWSDIGRFFGRSHAAILHSVEVHLRRHPEAPKPERWKPRV